MTDVFISYSRKDKTFVQRLHEALTAAKRDSWVDWEDIPRAADWLDEIFRGIDAADTFVFVVSPDSLASEICNEEAAYALAQRKRIIPLVHRDADEKALAGEWFNKAWEQQARDNWTAIKHLNWLFFRDSDDFDKEFRELLKAMDTDLAYIKAHTRLLVRAKEWDANQRNAAYVLRGDDLLQAENWLASGVAKEPKPTELHAEYVVASQKVREEERKRQRNLLQARLGLVLAVALIAVLGFVFISLRSSEQSSANATLAVQSTAVQQQASTAIAAQATSDRRADEAQSLLWANAAQQQFDNGDPVLALSLAIEANRLPNPSFTARRTLSNIAYNNSIVLRIRGTLDQGRFLALASYAPYALRSTCNSVSDSGFCQKYDVGLVDSETGQILSTLMQTKSPPPGTFSPNGKMVLTGAPDGANGLILWDTQSGKQLRTISSDSSSYYDMAFNPDASRFVTASYSTNFDARVFAVWDVSSGKQLFTFSLPFDFNGTVFQKGNALRYSPDGKWIAIGTLDHISPVEGRVLLVDANTGDILQDYGEQAGAVLALAFNPQTNHLFAGLGTGDLIEFDPVDHNPSVSQKLDVGGIFDIAFSLDGYTFFTGSDNGSTTLWTFASGVYKKLHTYRGHINVIDHIAFSSFNSAVSTSAGGDLITWDLLPGGDVSQIDLFNASDLFDADISPDDHLALASSATFFSSTSDVHDYETELFLWDIDTDTTSTISFKTGLIQSVRFSPDSNFALLGTEAAPDGLPQLILWDVKAGQAVWQTAWSGRGVQAVTFSPDGRTALVGNYEGQIFLIDTATGIPLRSFDGLDKPIQQLAFSPDGKLALSRSGDNYLFGRFGSVNLWDVETGKIVRRLAIPDTEGSTAAVFSPDGQTLLLGVCVRYGTAGGCAEGSIEVWDVASGTVVRSFNGTVGLMTRLAVSRDGRVAVSNGGYNATNEPNDLVVWDVESGEEMQRFNAPAPVVGLIIAPHGTTVQSIAQDKPLTSRLTVWQILASPDSLMNWVTTHRFIEPLDCKQRALYNVTPPCDASGTVPTPTPVSATPVIPTGTATETLAATLAFTPTDTPMLPTLTPSATFTPSPTELPEVLTAVMFSTFTPAPTPTAGS